MKREGNGFAERATHMLETRKQNIHISLSGVKELLTSSYLTDVEPLTDSRAANQSPDQ